MGSGGGGRGLQGHMHGETGCTGLLEGAGGLQGVRECMCGAPEGLWGAVQGANAHSQSPAQSPAALHVPPPALLAVLQHSFCAA